VANSKRYPSNVPSLNTSYTAPFELHVYASNRAKVPHTVRGFTTWEEMSSYASRNYLTSNRRADWPHGIVALYEGYTLQQIATNY
jgi:hypothetical protein